jgi:hypothetical protein
MGYIVPSQGPEEVPAEGEVEEVPRPAVRAALAKLEPKRVDQAKKHLDASAKFFEKVRFV